MVPLVDPNDSGDEVDDVVSAEEDEEDDAVELDEVSSVDDDAVPHQKITIDNKVCLFTAPITRHPSYDNVLRMHWSALEIVSS